jgi:hypothetical protein
MKVIATEVAAHLGMLTRKAATESRARTGEMASAKAAAHASAATEPAAHMSATTEPPAVSTPTTVSAPASPAARESVRGQSPGESNSRRQNDHGLAQHWIYSFGHATASILLKPRVGIARRCGRIAK